MNKEIETYIDFMVSDYSLPRVLYALDNNGVKDYAVTLEDNNLHIRIPKSHLQKVVYPELKESGEENCCNNFDKYKMQKYVIWKY